MPPAETPPPLSRHQVLHTTELQNGQDFTSRLWAKHVSRVIGDGGYQSTISRVPLGRSFLCFVDCPSPMHVEADGNKTKATLYLPLTGSMKILACGKKLTALPGGPALIPAKSKIAFQATGIQCILLEASAAKLQSHLSAYGILKSPIPPMAWDPSSPDASALAELLGFALREIDRDASAISPGIHLLRLESLILSLIARAVAARLTAPASRLREDGEAVIERAKAWIAENLRKDFHPSELAAAVGISPRTFQKIFLKFANTTPVHYVSDLRMECARAELLDPENTRTVSEIANALDFHHFGRFATGYHRKFGETPSATLKHSKCHADYPESEHK